MSGNKPLVTIVIPFYNDPFVTEAIESALGQTYQPLEIIVVNDGSDREAERLLPYAGRVHVLGKSNGGTATALNHGFRYASGEYVAWLSSDDRFLPRKVECQLRDMRARGLSISHTAFEVIDEQGRREKEPVKMTFASMADFYRTFLNANPVNGCTVMIKKSLFERLEGFRETYRYTHDYDFWVRSFMAGFSLGYLDEPLTEYRRHSAMGTMRHQKAIEREFKALVKEYRPRIQGLLNALEPIIR
ncbi:glycosyltransferase family 2 protein [Cohnella luojiensis]|uniref:Glycosyltransferase n=1 Tax=Cohnella luojiensis TaxID=652876 RepID=A0A4Y8M250_9BACL|nr:glycosyltransferase [Cohnella luojiensis]TFE27847.1 glycosyltransferase [Cohnella luojiensis]